MNYTYAVECDVRYTYRTETVGLPGVHTDAEALKRFYALGNDESFTKEYHINGLIRWDASHAKSVIAGFSRRL